MYDIIVGIHTPRLDTFKQAFSIKYYKCSECNEVSLKKIEIQLIYDAVLFSAVAQSDSVIHVYRLF